MAAFMIRYLMVVSFCLIAFTNNAHAESPKDVVELYHQRLLAALSAPTSTSDKARFDALAPAMDQAFDFETMIKTVVGRNWARSDASTQAALLGAFRQVSIATYADQFAGLKDGHFIVSGTRTGPRGLMLVDSVLKTPDEGVTLIYVTREKDGAWRIIDVLLDGGISELALRASEYAKILKSGGPENLINSLNEQTSSLLEN